MAVKYDSAILEAFAGRLYRRATTIALSYAMVGVLLGVVVSMTSAVVLPLAAGQSAVVCALTGLIGYLVGTGRAYGLKVRAQTLLCQVAIESNTRARSS